MTGETRAKKDRDPIFTVCLAIFLIATIAVLGVYIQENCFPTSDDTASVGDKVTVDYVGTFYAEYGDPDAVVFDTSIESIAKDSNIAKSNDFTERSSYSPLSLTLGDGSVLSMFNDAIIGHKVGETFEVYIDPEHGYVAPTTGGVLYASGSTMAATFMITESAFSEAYKDVSLKKGVVKEFETKFGWKAYAMLTEQGSLVSVTYAPELDTYEVYNDGTTVVKYTVKSVSNGQITYAIDIENPQKVDGGIKMIKLDIGDRTVYVTDINGDVIYYKEGSETANAGLFFQITLKSIE